MTERDRAYEQCAAIEHERWAHWQRYMHSRCTRNADGSLTIPTSLVARWEHQIRTPYAELSEAEKASDREQVDRYWPLAIAAGRREAAEELTAYEGDALDMYVEPAVVVGMRRHGEVIKLGINRTVVSLTAEQAAVVAKSLYAAALLAEGEVTT